MLFRTTRWLIVPLLFWGCVIDKPQSPSFETNLYLPLGERKTTGLDLVHQSDYISGDTTGVDPLFFVLRGDLTKFRVGTALDVKPSNSSFSAAPSSIRIAPPPSRHVEIALPSLEGTPIPDGTPHVVSSFAFSTRQIALEPIETFQWVRLIAGQIAVRVHNGLGVPFGAWPDTAIVVEITDSVTHQPVLRLSTNGVIAANGEVTLTAGLSGASFHHTIELAVHGMSPGSAGQPVLMTVDDAVVMDLSLSALAADSAYAPVPAQTMSVTQSISLARNQALHIISAQVLDGNLDLALVNGFPLPATITLSFPELTIGTGPFPPQIIQLPAAGRVTGEHMSISLAGARVEAPTRVSIAEVHYRVDAVSGVASSPVRIGLHQRTEGLFSADTLRFQEIEGEMDSVAVHITPTEKEFNIPDGIDQLDFDNAELSLEVESSLGLSSRAEVTLVATGDGSPSGTSMPLNFLVQKAPEHEAPLQTFTWDRDNSNVLEIIHARPQKLGISGTLKVGAPGEVGTVARQDSVSGRYVLTAPLRMKIGRVDYVADPFSFTLSDDEIRQIRDNLGSGAVRGQVENHFPAGLSVRMRFAEAEESLKVHPKVVLDSVTVASGQTDARGRVSHATTSAFTLAIPEEDVAFFAREKVYGQVVFRLSGEEPDSVVVLTALDYVKVNAMMEFRVKVKP